jgi:PAS domain-containing protein
LTASPARILLAEPSLAKLLAASLKERGAQVEEATGATDARLCARRQRFAAAVVPGRLPLPGGGRLLEALAGEVPDLPLVAVGPAEAGEILAALRAGAREYLVEGGEEPGDAADRVLRAARRTEEGGSGVPAEPGGLRLALTEARREIAERSDAFRELQEIFRNELERMLLAFERVGEGIVFADRAGGILLLNPAAGSWIGGTAHAAVGASLEGSIADPVLRGAILEDRLRALGGTPSARRLELSEGRRVLVETHPMTRGGEALGTLVLLRALTDEAGAGQNLRDLLRGVARRLGRTAKWLRASGRPESTAIVPELEEAARQLRATLRAREHGTSPPLETPGSLP